jgi:L-threonylcarbamoyladenylate synthase
METRLTVSVQEAAAALAAGELVALPTETVYGLAADAAQPEAVAKVFAAKGRPIDHPLIVHISDLSQLKGVVASVSPAVERVMKAFWPGPLTLVLPKHADFSSQVTGGQAWVAVRMPNHPLFLSVVHALGRPVVAPSANRYESISPTQSDHVLLELSGRIPWVLEGGPCEVGIESTIVRIRDEGSVELLRPGMISVSEIEAVLTPVQDSGASCSEDHIRVSGDRARHYAPQHPAVYLDSVERTALFAWLQKDPRLASTSVMMGFGPRPIECPDEMAWREMPASPRAYAHDWYAALRACDRSGKTALYIEAPPRTEVWRAVWDRLSRAAQPYSVKR